MTDTETEREYIETLLKGFLASTDRPMIVSRAMAEELHDMGVAAPYQVERFVPRD